MDVASHARQNGAPRARRAVDGKVRRMARRMRASSPQAQGCAVGEPRRRSRTRSTWMCGGRVRGVAFLWATFLWPRKERWLARPGGARKRTGMSMFRANAKMDPGLRRDDEQCQLGARISLTQRCALGLRPPLPQAGEGDKRQVS